MPDALPAVTVPSFLNAGRSLARPSRVVFGRTCSSVSKITVSFFFLTSIGTISSLKRPVEMAFAAFIWDS